MTSPSVETASVGKVAESTQDLERLLLGFHQGRRIRPNAVKRVRPLRAGWALGVEPEGRWVQEDPFAFDLLDYRAFGEHILEAQPIRQPAAYEVQAAQLGKRVILIP